MNQPETLLQTDQILFSDFAGIYLASVKHRLRSINQLRFRLNKFITRFNGKKLHEITRRDISDYVDERLEQGIKRGTINIEVSAISSAYRYAINICGWQIRNPATGQYLRHDEGRLRYLSADERRRLMHAAVRPRASSQLRDFVKLALNTGCRKSELLKLEWSHVDLESRLVTVISQNSKTGKRRIIPLNQAAASALQSRREYCDALHLRARYVFTKADGVRIKYIDQSFRRLVKRAQIDDFRIHDLRHTFASDLVRSGVSLYYVKNLLGHSTIKQTERYAHLATVELGEAVAKLDSLNQP